MLCSEWCWVVGFDVLCWCLWVLFYCFGVLFMYFSRFVLGLRFDRMYVHWFSFCLLSFLICVDSGFVLFRVGCLIVFRRFPSVFLLVFLLFSCHFDSIPVFYVMFLSFFRSFFTR